ncbi:hypothetical protein HIM_03439 [Hirsutella minnesotensis 3608]|uniref:Uncharacterized protein n=1 Tax=Hirsutella minnesotensis 3608 TaxID=1043627 RepID=A0A0F7ZVS4_9HYPO|nr:hypothetical protein HIM_03439 [Hirsutella minnesotensis 3608]
MTRSTICLLFLYALRVCAASDEGPNSIACTPTWILDGVTEEGFNKANTPFTFKPSCSELDAQSHAVFVTSSQDVSPPLGLGTLLDSTTITPNGITVPGLHSGAHSLMVFAKDSRGNHVLGSFALVFGSINMPVQVTDMSGRPVPGVALTIKTYPGVAHRGLTDASGKMLVGNLPAASIELSASAANRPIATMEINATSSVATLPLRLSRLALDKSDSVHGQQTSLLDTRAGARKQKRRGSCEPSPGRPICQPTCQNPPPHSCDFYEHCAEGTVHCGPRGYPLRYGAKNCRRFVSRIGSFSTKGQTWIWNTMSCLQRALIRPIEGSETTCDSIQKIAFKSHPVCYLDNGFCELPASDLLQVVITVKTDLFSGPAIDQVLQTAKGCLRRRISLGGNDERASLRSPTSSTEELDEVAILEDIERYLGTFA